MTVRSGSAEWHGNEAKRVCPVSRALAAIPEIVLTAKLAAGQ